MKKATLLLALCALVSAPLAANARPEVRVYYSPRCPHCHFAMDFINDTLVPEHPGLRVTRIDVTAPENAEIFVATIENCGLTGFGVPLVVIGGECIRGFSQAVGEKYRAILNSN